MDLASSTVMVPSLPTLSIASAMISPMVVVPVGGNGGDLLDFFLVLDLLGDLVELGHGGFDGLVDAALDADGVGAGGDELQAFAINRFGQNRRRGGAVAGGVAGLAGDFADHLGAHVFIGVFQFDFLGHRHAVLGDGGGAEFFVDDHVAALGSERGDDRLGEFLDAAQERLPRLLRRISIVLLP